MFRDRLALTLECNLPHIKLLWIALIQTNGLGLRFEDQHEALLTLRLNCWPQGGLETNRKECKVKNA